MAIKCALDVGYFTFSNNTRVGGTNFPDITPDNYVCASWWTYLTDANPCPEHWDYHGTDESFIRIGHNGINWIWSYRNQIGPITQHILGPIAVGRWTYIAYYKARTEHRVWIFTEAEPPVGIPLPPMSQRLFAVATINFPFSLFTFIINKKNAVCNYKFYNSIMTTELIDRNRWEWNQVVEPDALWSTNLRVPGDLNSKTPVFIAPWKIRHEWTSYPEPGFLSYLHDPKPLDAANCFTWVYPEAGVENVDLFIQPNLPIMPGESFWTALQIFKLQDRRSVPLDAIVKRIKYHGYNYSVGSGLPHNSVWAIYRDHLEVDHADTSNAIRDQIDVDGAAPYDSANIYTNLPMTVANIYQWDFGVQFKWIYDGIIGRDGAVAHFSHAVVSIDYVGVFSEAIQDLSGIYFINSNREHRRDIYYNDTELRIPNPTVRTALLGE